MKDFEAGKVVRLDADTEVVLGSVVEIENHPSGVRFDGPAVIVRAFLGSLGAHIVVLVSLSDPSEREVTRCLKPGPISIGSLKP